MKKYDLKFSNDMFERIESNNDLNRFNEIRKTLKMISLIEDNTVIAIDGDWGCGKTFFLREIEYIFKNKEKRPMFQLENEFSYNGVTEKYLDVSKLDNSIVLYYNAWENDMHIDPLQSLLLFLLNELEGNEDIIVGFKEFKEDLPQNILKVLNGIGSSFLGGINNKIKDITGIDTKEVIDGTIDIVKSINNMTTYKDLADSITTTDEIKKAINDILKTILKENTRIVFIVDELDRCRPDYAVRLLESIKHFYDNEKITFIMGVNIKELESTIKKFYGETFDGYRYLHKFFDVITSIKKIDSKKYFNFALENGYGHSMGEIEEKHSDSFQRYENILESMLAFADVYNFSLRDINRYLLMYEMVKPTIGSFSGRDGKETYATINFLIPLILALKVKNESDTRAFYNGTPNFKDICSKMSQRFIKEYEEVLGQNLADIMPAYYEKFSKKRIYYDIVNII